MDDPHTNNPITIEHDALLVARARENRDAFAALYLRYFDRVHGYCWRRLGNPDDAADATSAIFQRAIESLTTCREESFRSWLFAIAHNVLADFYRSRRVHQFLNDEMLIQDPGALPEEQVMSQETTHMVTRLLAQLPADQRQVLELRLAGLTSKEIGAVLGKNPNAVDQAQFRAVRRLREVVGQSATVMEGLR